MVASTTAEEQPLPLTKAGRFFQSNPSVQTLIRWIGHGVLGPDRKTRVKLRSLLIGGRRFVDPDAAREFIAACNATPPIPASSSAGKSSKALETLGF